MFIAIIQPPQNQSVCEGGTVDFTCIVMFTGGTPSAATWFTDNGGTEAITQPDHTRTDDSNGRSAPANVTTVLTVTNVNISDNGTDYTCVQGINARSDTVFLTVLGGCCINVTGLVKTYIVHASTFSTLKIHKICYAYQTGMKLAGIVELLSLYSPENFGS